MKATRQVLDALGRDADRSCASRDIFDHNGICSNLGVVTNDYRSKYFSTCPNVHMSSNDWNAGSSVSYGDLLKYEAVHSDPGLRMDRRSGS